MRGLRGVGIQGLAHPVFSAASPGGFSLPYSIDFTLLPNGSFPSPWIAPSTWQISTAKAVCTPVTFSGEVYSDPGLEGSYTAGLSDVLFKNLASTCTEELVDVHGGAKAQSVDWTVDNAYVYRAANVAVANKYVKLSLWAKKTGAGTTRTNFNFTGDAASDNYTPNITVDWAQYSVGRICMASVMLRALVNSSAGNPDVAITDDHSLTTYSESEIFAFVPESSANVTVKAGITLGGGYACGIVARADSVSSPQNYLVAYVAVGGVSSPYARLYKVVGGVVSRLTSGGVAYAAGRLLEIRCSGTTVQLFYNGAQVGTDQTVSDAGIVNNTIHGIISLDGSNSLNSFFVT